MTNNNMHQARNMHTTKQRRTSTSYWSSIHTTSQ